VTASVPANRRIDRVLSGDYLAELSRLSLDEARSLRDEVAQEETDISYLRRLLQGRIDIIRAELDRRARGAGTSRLVDDLPKILADQSPAMRGLGRHLPREPSRVDEHRRHVESLIADADLGDVTSRTDEELRAALTIYEAEERAQSQKRRAVQAVSDACNAEIARRYRDGEADVGALLER
jgi:hypothetical protein